MGFSQVGLPTRTKVDPAFRQPLDLTARLQCAPGRPRVVRMPSDWWDSPAVAACPLTPGVQSGRTARRFTRSTLKEWGLAQLADDAEAIVGEFVANAISHAARCLGSGQPLGLRLLRRTGEVMCAVLDPSDSAPVLRVPDRNEETGRGLQMVDALSDVWGWSPVTGRGKAVWAILFCVLSHWAPSRGNGADVSSSQVLSYSLSSRAGSSRAGRAMSCSIRRGRPRTDAMDLAVREGGRHRDQRRRAAGGHIRQPG
jgi:anti-sigma regulatory factor (Ser/Thr protein kinase)